MRVQLNGEAKDVRNGLTVEELVHQLGLSARRVAVEINRDIVPHEGYTQHALCDGDVVEIVQFVGGG